MRVSKVFALCVVCAIGLTGTAQAGVVCTNWIDSVLIEKLDTIYDESPTKSTEKELGKKCADLLEERARKGGLDVSRNNTGIATWFPHKNVAVAHCIVTDTEIIVAMSAFVPRRGADACNLIRQVIDAIIDPDLKKAGGADKK